MSADVIDFTERTLTSPEPDNEREGRIIRWEEYLSEADKDRFTPLAVDLSQSERAMFFYALHSLSRGGHGAKSRNGDRRILQAERRAAEIRKWHELFEKDGNRSPELDAAFGALLCDCWRIIAETRAKSPEALAAKVRMIREGQRTGLSDYNETAIKTLLTGLDGLA